MRGGGHAGDRFQGATALHWTRDDERDRAFHGHGRRRAIDVQGGRDSVRDKLFPEYEKALCALVEKYRAAGFAQIGCANVNTMHAAVLARKRYRDMTGNNINHCNDFSARIYRDTILAAMGILP